MPPTAYASRGKERGSLPNRRRLPRLTPVNPFLAESSQFFGYEGELSTVSIRLYPWHRVAILVAKMVSTRPFHYSPKFRRWLCARTPRDELIARMALSDDIRDPFVSRAWEARIAELQADLIKTADDWVQLLLAVRGAKQTITGIARTQGSQAH
jgi:hypothetical protein